MTGDRSTIKSVLYNATYKLNKYFYLIITKSSVFNIKVGWYTVSQGSGTGGRTETRNPHIHTDGRMDCTC